MDVLLVSNKLKVAPVLVVRELLKNMGHSRKIINKILNKEIKVSQEIEAKIDKACLNDPVYSPLGVEYAKKRGEDGENILNLWLILKNLKFERDLGSGTPFPDFLLEKPIKIFGRPVSWIESKCYYGGTAELKEDEEQFKKFNSMGEGVIIYWFGHEKKTSRYLLSGENLRTLLPDDLKSKVDELLNFIPPEFLHLLKKSEKLNYNTRFDPNPLFFM